MADRHRGRAAYLNTIRQKSPMYHMGDAVWGFSPRADSILASHSVALLIHTSHDTI
jgi:hypothetical protein